MSEDTVVHAAGGKLPCGCRPWNLTPARRLPDGEWQPAKHVESVDVATQIATVAEWVPDPARTYVRIQKRSHIDGVRLFCFHGEVTAEVLQADGPQEPPSIIFTALADVGSAE